MLKWGRVILLNTAGAGLLLLLHFISDYFHFVRRTGFEKTSPYLFLLLMYVWIVFHNQVLFGNLYLSGRKARYFFWTLLFMAASSLNMHYILKYGFDVSYTFPQIMSFWLYTLAGLGVFVLYRNFFPRPAINPNDAPNTLSRDTTGHLRINEGGSERQVPFDTILWIESLENYIKIKTVSQSFMMRLSMKEAEQIVPKPAFVRISRSHLVNTKYISEIDSDSVLIKGEMIRIGKVYKKYFEDQLKLLKGK